MPPVVRDEVLDDLLGQSDAGFEATATQERHILDLLEGELSALIFPQASDESVGVPTMPQQAVAPEPAATELEPTQAAAIPHLEPPAGPFALSGNGHANGLHRSPKGGPCPVCGFDKLKEIEWAGEHLEKSEARWSVCKSCGLTFIYGPHTDVAEQHRTAMMRKAILRNVARPLAARLSTNSLSAVIGVESDPALSKKWFCKRNVVWVPSSNELPREQYDLIVLPLTLECEAQPIRALTRIRSFLSPSGSVCIAVFDSKPWRRIVLGHKWTGFSMPNQRVTFDLKCLDRMLRMADLRAIPDNGLSIMAGAEPDQGLPERATVLQARRVSTAEWVFSPRFAWQRLSRSIALVHARPV